MDFAQQFCPMSLLDYRPSSSSSGTNRAFTSIGRNAPANPHSERTTVREEAQAFAKRAHGAVQWARENLFKAQKHNPSKLTRHRREPDFG